MHRSKSRTVRLTVVSALLGCLLGLPTAAASQHNGISWHTSLDEAKAASVVSKRPVLAIFGATWSEDSVTFHSKTLANAEVMAIVTACFEPVKIDVDADPATTKLLGVTYLPSVCVIGRDDRVLARFDCPETPAGFVAAAGRAAQEAGLACREEQAPAASPAISERAPSEPVMAPEMPQAPRYSQFAAASEPPVESTAAVTQRTVIEPDPPSTAPWATPPTEPLAEASSAASWAAPAAPPSAPHAAPPTAPATASWATPPTEPSSAMPSSASPPLTTTPRLEQPPSAVTYGTTPPPSATAALPPTSPPPSAPEKPKSANGFWSMFQNPFSGLSKQPKIASEPPPAPPPVPTAGASDVYGTMPLGLEGYCPVTLAEKGSWVEGRAQWGVRHRGRTYLFAGESQQRAFLNDPDRYAPALSGDDPVLAFDTGKSVPGQRRYGVTYQSRMYLFSSPETRTAFSSAPQRYTARVAMAEHKPTASGTILR